MGGHDKTDCSLQTVYSAQTVQTVQFFLFAFSFKLWFTYDKGVYAFFLLFW